jgi:hypothetical protein
VDSKGSDHDEDHISSSAGPIAHKICRDMCKNMIHVVIKGFVDFKSNANSGQRVVSE